jgi:hypothetical protein
VGVMFCCLCKSNRSDYLPCMAGAAATAMPAAGSTEVSRWLHVVPWCAKTTVCLPLVWFSCLLAATANDTLSTSAWRHTTCCRSIHCDACLKQG